jgi:hypothetical protein
MTEENCAETIKMQNLKTGILNQSSHPTPSIPTTERKEEAIRRPLPDVKHKDLIINTLLKLESSELVDNWLRNETYSLKQIGPNTTYWIQKQQEHIANLKVDN